MIQVSLQVGQADTVFANIISEWQELFAGASVSPFLSWEWMSVWFENFGGDRDPAIFTVYRDEELIGILPMLFEKISVFGQRVHRITMMGDRAGGADYLDIIARPENRAEALAAVLEHLRSDADLMQFASLPGESPTISLLENYCLDSGRNYRYSISAAGVCPYIELTDGWDAVLRQSKRSSNFKRRLKQIEKMPDFEYRSVTSVAETSGAFERFLYLHEKRWESSGGSELTGHRRLISFQRQLVDKLSQAGLIRFDELWLDGKCRGSVYGLDNGETFYYYNSGYDTEYSGLSVGLVLLGLSIRSAVERGNTTYDFLRGEETYKFDWAHRSNELVTVTLSGDSLPVRLDQWAEKATSVFRDGAKLVLPASAAETLASWRRGLRRRYQMEDQ